MTLERMTTILKNSQTSCSKLNELYEENDFTHEQLILLTQHPNTGNILLCKLWNDYSEDAKIATIIAGRGKKLNNNLLENIVETLTHNPHNWELEEWEAVMDAFRNTIRTEFLFHYYYLYDFTFSHKPTKTRDFDVLDDDNEWNNDYDSYDND